MARAYSIATEAIAAGRARVRNDLANFDASQFLPMDELTLRDVGPHAGAVSRWVAALEWRAGARPNR